jgi:hypothetical protein
MAVPSFNGAPSWVKNQYYIRWNGSAWVMSEDGLYPAGYFTSTSGSPTTIPATGWTLHSNCGGGSNLTFSGATGVINVSYSYVPSAADVAAGSVNLTYTTSGGSCGIAQSIKKITFTPLTTPAFNQVAAICSGASLAALPTTSTNGITGTWSPALNSTATTTYTFTPNAGPCAATATMTITVNPLPSGFSVGGGGNYCTGGTGVTIYIGGSTVGVNYDLKLGGSVVATLAGTGSDLYFNNVTAAGNYTVVATNQTTNCTAVMPGFATVSVTAPVTPTFTQVAAICSGTSLSALPTTSNNGIAGTWSPALNSTATTTYTFTPNAGPCATTATMTITVSPLPAAPTVTGGLQVCLGYGGTTTDLLAASPATSPVFHWYDQATGGTLLASTAAFTTPSLSANTDFYVDVTSNGCTSARKKVSIAVNTFPIQYTVSGTTTLCPGSGGATITLSNSETAVLYFLKKDGVNVDNRFGTGSAMTFTGITAPGTYTIVGINGGCANPMLGSATDAQTKCINTILYHQDLA